MERYLKFIYIAILSTVLILETFYVLLLFPTSRFLEFLLINFGGIIIAVLISLFLEKSIKKVPSMKIFVREVLWIFIIILALTSYGGFNPGRVSIENIYSFFGPAALLGASFLVSRLALDALKRIQHWEIIGIRSTELTDLVNDVESILQERENEEISWVYGNIGYLALLFITGQMNLILILISDILEKLVSETYKMLNIPIPKNEKGSPVGFVKKADHLNLSLRLNNSDFDLEKFWTLRGKYIHSAIGKTLKIVPPEEEMIESIKLLSKTLREYPIILKNLYRKEG